MKIILRGAIAARARAEGAEEALDEVQKRIKELEWENIRLREEKLRKQ